MKTLTTLTALMIVIALLLIFADLRNELLVVVYLSTFFVVSMWIATVIELVMDKVNKK